MPVWCISVQMIMVDLLPSLISAPGRKLMNSCSSNYQTKHLCFSTVSLSFINNVSQMCENDQLQCSPAYLGGWGLVLHFEGSAYSQVSNPGEHGGSTVFTKPPSPGVMRLTFQGYKLELHYLLNRVVFIRPLCAAQTLLLSLPYCHMTKLCLFTFL